MKKFLSILMSLVLLVTLVPRSSFAGDELSMQNQGGTCSVRDDCSCDCTCTKDANGSFLCKFSKDCPCLDVRKGLFYYPKLLFGKVWAFLSDDAAAMWNAFGQFTWFQNIFNVVALFFVGALMFRN